MCIRDRCNTECAAAHADDAARTRQGVRNVLRGEPALSYESENKCLRGVFKETYVSTAKLDDPDNGFCSEWLTTATRHKPSYLDKLSDRFVTSVAPYDEYDGWVELKDLLDTGRPKAMISDISAT
eukprot:9440779-Pyramimonas_sp.AAC.1